MTRSERSQFLERERRDPSHAFEALYFGPEFPYHGVLNCAWEAVRRTGPGGARLTHATFSPHCGD
jgi:hypothetical protein